MINSIEICQPIETFQRHVFIRGGRVGKDEVFDAWVVWFESKGVPYRIVESENGKRTLFKHQTRIVADAFAPCCEDFDEKLERRDLSDEVLITGLNRRGGRKKAGTN